MRTWLLILLAVGIGTASGMHWWRANSEVERPEVETASVDPLDPVEGDEVEPAPIEIGDETVADPQSSAEAIESDPAAVGSGETVAADPEAEEHSEFEDAVVESEVEIPGGAVAESDAEARRKANALVEQAAKTTNPIEQARLLTQALRSGSLDRAFEEKAYSELLQAHRRGFLNPRVDDLCMRTEVKKGDNLWGICRRAEKESQIRVSPGLIRLVNGLTSDSIYPGSKLKIPTQPITILVEKSRFRLEVYAGDLMLRRYLVGLGKDNCTPEGEFTIATRLIDPPWYKPGVGQISAENPENILGTRWLGFGPKEGFPEAAKYGIHGTRDETTIGTESSAGCVRMRNAEVEELFEWIAEGVKVEIRP